MRKAWTVICFFVVVGLANTSLGVVVTIGLGDVADMDLSPYVVHVEQMPIYDHSEIVLLVENIEDPLRYKEWELTVWIPEGYEPLTQLDVLDFEKSNPATYLEIFDVPMAADQTAVQIPGYNAYYADTLEAAWYEFGTQPIGENWERVDIGNPEWVSFHFRVDELIPQSTPVYISIHDNCIPEPATICLLGLGVLVLHRRKGT